jgi:hypothetical protein
MYHLFHWLRDHWSAIGYITLVWVVPVAIVYLSNKLFHRRLSL